MPKTPTREELIRRGKQLRQLYPLTRGFQDWLMIGLKKLQGKEKFIETGVGRIRTLCYGFDEGSAAGAVFFELHGGGFILGSPGMDETLNLEFKERAGCKVISIEYAKAPEFPYPAAVNQVYAVVEHVFD